MGRTKKTTNINTPKAPKIQSPKLICMTCGKNDTETKFYASRNPKYSFWKKLPWCFTCIDTLYSDLFKRYEDSTTCMYQLCEYLDIPFSYKILEIAKNRQVDGGVNIWQGYLTYYNSVGGKKEGICFKDGDIIENSLSNSKIENLEEFDIPEQYIFDWGEGFNLSDYEYLEQELADCQKTLKCDVWSEETLLREICIKKLEIRIARKEKQDTKDLIRELQDLMKTCAVDPAKTTIASAGKSLDAFGVWIKDIEQSSPAEWFEDQDKYKDMDGFDDYIKKYILRPIKNFITGSRDFNVDKDVMIDFDNEHGDE